MDQDQDQEYKGKYFDAEDTRRLKEIINEGCRVLDEIDLLKSGLTETIKDVAEQVDIKYAQLSKAVRICHKKNLHEEKDKLQEIEDILEAAGKLS